MLAGIGVPFEAIGSAVESLNRYRNEPVGRIRLNVLEHASALLLGPVMPIFVERYPEIEVEVMVTNHLVDVTAQLRADVARTGLRARPADRQRPSFAE